MKSLKIIIALVLLISFNSKVFSEEVYQGKFNDAFTGCEWGKKILIGQFIFTCEEYHYSCNYLPTFVLIIDGYSSQLIMQGHNYKGKVSRY